MSKFNYEDFVLILANEEDYKDHDALKQILKNEFNLDCLRANPRKLQQILLTMAQFFTIKKFL
ncbi:hypothetical protein [Shouchella miscanthi]|uniref:Uncharacterized protein n=1 Tax=Shouchella miscanthi TaxID=2598861 RepID=A0ABU6NR40_9BACI|nr:hypothetical protein [Shouchella miscanthi]